MDVMLKYDTLCRCNRPSGLQQCRNLVLAPTGRCGDNRQTFIHQGVHVDLRSCLLVGPWFIRTFRLGLCWSDLLASLVCPLQGTGTPRVLRRTWTCADVDPGLALLDTGETAVALAGWHRPFVTGHASTVAQGSYVHVRLASSTHAQDVLGICTLSKIR